MIPTTTYEVQMIPIGQIAESPFNPRKTFLDMEDLVEDVRKRGILQPVLVRPNGGKGYELVFGARRYRAAKGAKLETDQRTSRLLDEVTAAPRPAPRWNCPKHGAVCRTPNLCKKTYTRSN